MNTETKAVMKTVGMFGKLQRAGAGGEAGTSKDMVNITSEPQAERKAQDAGSIRFFSRRRRFPPLRETIFSYRDRFGSCFIKPYDVTGGYNEPQTSPFTRKDGDFCFRRRMAQVPGDLNCHARRRTRGWTRIYQNRNGCMPEKEKKEMSLYTKVNTDLNFVEREHEVEQFWEDNKNF